MKRMKHKQTKVIARSTWWTLYDIEHEGFVLVGGKRQQQWNAEHTDRREQQKSTYVVETLRDETEQLLTAKK